jgi:conjugal transfer pilus assembly protein TraW
VPFHKTTTICFLFILVALTASLASGKHLGTVGRVYPVVEPDALVEIRETAARVDWRKAIDKEKMMTRIKNFRPEYLHPLPVAGANRTFLQDMTYTLDIDIPDPRGGILYPKGFSFNPLDYVNLTSTLVVIDAGDRRQVDWFKTSPYADDYRTRLLLAGGDYYDLAEELGRPIFYLMDTMARRLRLTAVPSVIRQEGNMLEVREMMVPHE